MTAALSKNDIKTEIETAGNSPFERKGISLAEKRHISDREKAYLLQRNGLLVKALLLIFAT